MNKDPVFRGFIILVLGIILFQMIFNLITGGSRMEDMGSSNILGNTTTSIDNLITGLMVLLIKVLIIALMVLIVCGIFLLLKKNYFNNIDLKQQLNKSPMLKSILSITGVVVGLFFLMYVYNYLVNPTPGYSNSLLATNNTEHATGGFNGTLGITGVFTFLINVLIYVFVISLIISLLVFLKKQLEASGIHLFSTNQSNTKEADKNATASKETASEDV
ncbi:MAG: hypothetical protein K0R34_2937 [Herbinix sp.]|jgi:flagellar basal body-associated protein FliL|nr:hypothetical protein [Herbinix sp.]